MNLDTYIFGEYINNKTMGRIDLYKAKLSNEYNDNILAQYKFIANKIDLIRIFDLFAKSSDLLQPTRACYMYGYGSQSKTIYKELKQNSKGEYEVIWFGYNGPKKFKFLSYIAASASGLIRINNQKYITLLLETLSHLSMVGIFSIEKKISIEFEKNILDNIGNLNVEPECYVKKDRSFFYFIIDGDSYDEENEGFLCQTALGKECPDSLFKIIEFTNKRW